MTRRRGFLAAAIVLAAACWLGLQPSPGDAAGWTRVAVPDRPDRPDPPDLPDLPDPPDLSDLPELTDQEFWALIDDLSEPSRRFESDNLVSNEIRFQQVIPELTRIAKPGRAFIGVGPEQNFTYISALQPGRAFIVDIRRGNLHLHLLYKALFELSADRNEFVSRLFSRPRLRRLNAKSTASELFGAFRRVFPTERLSLDTMAAVRQQLVTKHGFAVSDADLRGIEYVHRGFRQYGPSIRYGASPARSNVSLSQPTYTELMTATDAHGVPRAFLASEEAFAFVKNLHSRNLIVPIVGDFAGPKAIRAVGSYLKQKGAVVSAFYVSNVEEYLRRDRVWSAFCENVATLPLDETSTFIRSIQTLPGARVEGLLVQLGPMVQTSGCR